MRGSGIGRVLTGLWRPLRALAAALVLAGVLVAASAPAVAAQPPQPSRQDEFVPVDQLPPQEQVPAAPLLIAAYAVAWVAILLYLWSLWSRLGRVEKEMADLGRRLEAGSRR
jgi:CcmD family protein